MFTYVSGTETGDLMGLGGGWDPWYFNPRYSGPWDFGDPYGLNRGVGETKQRGVGEPPYIDPITGLPTWSVTGTGQMPPETQTQTPPPEPSTGQGQNVNEPPYIDPVTGLPTWTVTGWGTPVPEPIALPQENWTPPTEEPPPANMGAVYQSPSTEVNMGAYYQPNPAAGPMYTAPIYTEPQAAPTTPPAGQVNSFPINTPPPSGQVNFFPINNPVTPPPSGQVNFAPVYPPPPLGQVNNFPVYFPPVTNFTTPPPPAAQTPPGATQPNTGALAGLTALAAGPGAPLPGPNAPLVGSQGYKSIFGGAPKLPEVPPLSYFLRGGPYGR